MLKWVFSLAAILVTLGLYYSVRYGVAPRAVPLIKATEVESLQEAGVLVYRRMRQDIRSNNTLLAGSLPYVSEYWKFWQGFVLGAQNDGAEIDEVLAMGGMQPFKEQKALNTKIISGPLTLESVEANKRQLFYLPSTETTHLSSQDFSEALEKAKIKKVSITLHKFLPTKQMVKSRKLQCDDKNENQALLLELDCLSEKVSQQHYRKDLDPNKKYITLYRYGLSDYIAFWWP